MAVYRIKRKVTSDGPGNYKKTEKKVRKAPGEFSEEYSHQEESTKVFSKDDDKTFLGRDRKEWGTVLATGTAGLGLGTLGLLAYKKNLRNKIRKTTDVVKLRNLAEKLEDAEIMFPTLGFGLGGSIGAGINQERRNKTKKENKENDNSKTKKL